MSDISGLVFMNYREKIITSSAIEYRIKVRLTDYAIGFLASVLLSLLRLLVVTSVRFVTISIL